MSSPAVLVYEDDPAQAQSAAVAALNAGQCIVYPTDTVYGLLARCDHAPAYREIFRLKQRSADQPMALLVHHEHPAPLAALALLAGETALAARFHSGTLTVVLDAPALPGIPPAAREIQPGSLGLRCPADVRTRALLLACQVPLWATSVNRAGEPPAATTSEVRAWLAALPGQERPLAVLTADALPGTASAVVRLTPDGPLPLR